MLTRAIFVFSLLFFLFIGASAQTKTTAIEWQANYKTALKLAQQSGKPILLNFNAVWCKQCETMNQSFWTQPEVVALSRDFICVTIDFDKDPKIIALFGVNSVPHVRTTDPWSNMLAFHHGFGKNSPEALVKLMTAAPKDFSEIKESNELLEKEKGNVSALIKIGEFYRLRDIFYLSNNYFNRALRTKEIEDDLAKKEILLIATANNYLKIRDLIEAERIFNLALQDFPNGSHKETAFLGLIMVKLQRKRIVEAEKVFEQMKAQYPDSQATQKAAENLQQVKGESK